MRKRKDFTLSTECISILKQAQKLNPRKISLSELVEHAINNTYQNKAEALKAEAREYQKKIMEIKDRIKHLEEK